jgi:hypothetical protein
MTAQFTTTGVIFMFIHLPGKMDYPQHRSGKLPDGSLHVFPSNYQELPEFSPKKFLLALKRVTGNRENATKT